MIIENEHFRKYKGTWRRDQVEGKMKSLPKLSSFEKTRLANIVDSAAVLHPKGDFNAPKSTELTV